MALLKKKKPFIAKSDDFLEYLWISRTYSISTLVPKQSLVYIPLIVRRIFLLDTILFEFSALSTGDMERSQLKVK